jgi:hypothetical protein
VLEARLELLPEAVEVAVLLLFGYARDAFAPGELLLLALSEQGKNRRRGAHQSRFYAVFAFFFKRGTEPARKCCLRLSSAARRVGFYAPDPRQIVLSRE